jgi:hypothetical protein
MKPTRYMAKGRRVGAGVSAMVKRNKREGLRYHAPERREAADLYGRLQNERRARVMTEGLAADMGRRLRDLQDEVRKAKRIAGAMSVLWPAQALEHGGEPGDQVRVSACNDVGVLGGPDKFLSAMSFQTLTLDMVLTHIQPDALRRAVHAEVEFRGQRRGYGLTEQAVLALRDAGQLHDVMLKHIAPILLRELLDATAPGHRERRMRG